MHDEPNKTSEIANAQRESLEKRLLEKLEALEQRLPERDTFFLAEKSLGGEHPQINSNTPSATTRDIWERGDRAIALAAGGGVLGGAIAQIPGAIVGAVFGATLGLFGKSRRSVSENQ